MRSSIKVGFLNIAFHKHISSFTHYCSENWYNRMYIKNSNYKVKIKFLDTTAHSQGGTMTESNKRQRTIEN